MSEPTTNTNTNTNTTGQVQNEPATNNSNAEWKSSLDKIFEKLDSIIDNKSNSVARSALRDNGFEDEEIKSIVKQWRENKQTQTQENNTKMNELTSQVGTLKNQLIAEKVNNQAFLCGLDLGLDSKTIPYVVKLADLSKATGENGEISIENIKTAMSKVLEDVPSFKSSNNNNGFVKIGANTSQGGNATQDDILAGIFGTKRK